MKRTFTFLFLMISVFSSYSQVIEEIDYDQAGTDNAEFVDVYLPSGSDPAHFQLLLYNGANGLLYNTINLNGANVTPYPATGGTIYTWDPTSNDQIQNGAPDGICLYNSNTSTSIQFWSYEGTFTATNGPINGQSSVDTGIQENNNAPNYSMQYNFVSQSWYLDIPNITLSVNLLSFNIEVIGKYLELNWKTSTEVNSSHFEIERATEANLFKGIGKVLAAGNSSEERSYTYTDEKPVKGNNYYRLKMIDNDGTYRYSEVVSAHFGNTHTGLILTPNLVHSSLKISFEAPVENGRVLIYNLDGKLVQSYLLAEGIDVLRVDVSDLVSGQYVIQYQSNQGSETVRFVKE